MQVTRVKKAILVLYHDLLEKDTVQSGTELAAKQKTSRSSKPLACTPFCSLPNDYQQALMFIRNVSFVYNYVMNVSRVPTNISSHPSTNAFKTPSFNNQSVSLKNTFTKNYIC